MFFLEVYFVLLYVGTNVSNLSVCWCMGLCFVSAVCSGEITDSAGVVLSPNWPEAYDKGQDCIWGIHVEEDKRIMLDIQVCVKTNQSILNLLF